ncbi:class I SAM-dependent DNA methyltransferase [Pontixanthobacter rizhaonensis]|uniref:class I SAM-dependent DNA methyltransferase n=1 Tax=Pontixanthobacter rizhaonensis TaxID=2730337 RepID=UPI001FE34A51|nr:DNA methyltransferase [Pontixanthobacter rizhaonensis]
MRLGWDEIGRRAKKFSEDWAGETRERAETQTFYNEFFNIFGISRRQTAIYEKRVNLLKKKHGFIDLFWPGTLLVEQKSGSLDLDRAQGQALDYLDGIHATEQPRYILTCDFQNWRLLDLEENTELTFTLPDLHKHITAFDFMLGRRVNFERQEAVTIKAAELMGRVHDALHDNGYTGHDLERFLVRLLFCMFADDTGIFQPKDIFLQLIDNDTMIDGSNVGRVINELFEVLDTPEDKRQSNLSGELAQFPYINGELFSENLRTPIFDAKLREDLLDACRHDWSAVSPAIFGSLFQSVMDAKQRRAKGAHYTSEENILKVIGPLFLDELRLELEELKVRRTAKEKTLLEFQARLSRMTFLDPACGCGNFLVVTYREIRRLELECLQELYGDQRIDAELMTRITVNQFYGIEYEEFPAMIAEVAMWMADHIANNEINEAFRLNYARIPLTEGAHIRHADALELDWNDVLPATKCHYIIGNPPFIGAKYQSKEQRAQVRSIANLGGSGGTLDYVAAWFLKAGQYLNGNTSPLPLAGGAGGGQTTADAQRDPADRAPPLTPPASGRGTGNHRIKIAFVSTNSITQGEQVAQLWPLLFDRYKLEIAFAHRTFNWFSEAKGKAHVHVVIIGLTHRDFEPKEKRLFSYPDIKTDPVESTHGALTAYLFDAKGAKDRHLVIAEAKAPLSAESRLIIGSKPIDGGNFIFKEDEWATFCESEPRAKKYGRPYVGAHEFINGYTRKILALHDIEPSALRAMPSVLERVNAVRQLRENSKSKPTQDLALTPTRYHINVLPKRPFMLLPRVSSERRDYVPFGWVKPPTIPSDAALVLIDATLAQFAILTSRTHMAWLSHIGGRLKNDFRYSIGLVYNTFPWPDASDKQRTKIEKLAQAVLDARENHPTSSLADLYDPDTMPADLRKAHRALDLAVDKLYRSAPFDSDRDRVEHLFGRYEALVNPLATKGAAKNKRVARKTAKKDKA